MIMDPRDFKRLFDLRSLVEILANERWDKQMVIKDDRIKDD